MRHVYSNKDTSVLSQGADAYADESPFILAGATVLRTGGDRRGGRRGRGEAGGFNAAG